MNKYAITQIIDEGAYGVVVKATNKLTQQTVAIKKFKDDNTDEFIWRSIEREVAMLKALRSSHVIQLKEALKKNSKVYLVFQYMQANVLKLLDQSGCDGLEKGTIDQIIYQLVRAVDYLHSKNVIHRDLKPENLLVNIKQRVPTDGSCQLPSQTYIELKLCDFGFTRFMPPLRLKNFNLRLTEYVATRWYRSPQLLARMNYGLPVDMWAIGCILGQLIDGQPMFPGDDEIDQFHLIKKMCGELPPDMEEAFMFQFPEASVNNPSVILPPEVRYASRHNTSKPMLDFLKACLRPDPALRLTARQALRHPYLLPMMDKHEARSILSKANSPLSIRTSRKLSHQKSTDTVDNKFGFDRARLRSLQSQRQIELSTCDKIASPLRTNEPTTKPKVPHYFGSEVTRVNSLPKYSNPQIKYPSIHSKYTDQDTPSSQFNKYYGCPQPQVNTQVSFQGEEPASKKVPNKLRKSETLTKYPSLPVIHSPKLKESLKSFKRISLVDANLTNSGQSQPKTVDRHKLRKKTQITTKVGLKNRPFY